MHNNGCPSRFIPESNEKQKKFFDAQRWEMMDLQPFSTTSLSVNETAKECALHGSFPSGSGGCCRAVYAEECMNIHFRTMPDSLCRKNAVRNTVDRTGGHSSEKDADILLQTLQAYIALYQADRFLITEIKPMDYRSELCVRHRILWNLPQNGTLFTQRENMASSATVHGKTPRDRVKAKKDFGLFIATRVGIASSRFKQTEVGDSSCMFQLLSDGIFVNFRSYRMRQSTSIHPIWFIPPSFPGWKRIYNVSSWFGVRQRKSVLYRRRLHNAASADGHEMSRKFILWMRTLHPAPLHSRPFRSHVYS